MNKRFISIVLTIGLFVAMSGSAFAVGVDANTTLMLHADGDQSGSAHTVTSHGDPDLNASTKKFGDGSVYFDGGDDYLTAANHADFGFGSNDFTIDFWVYVVAYDSDGDNYVMWGDGAYTGGVNSHNWIVYAANGDLRVRLNSGGTSTIYSSNYTIPTGGWHHVAIVRDGNNLKQFVDGDLKKTDDITGTTITASNYQLQMAHALFGNSIHEYFNGYLDEVRISNGVARWTSSFSGSLPSTPYDSDANTDLLMHFDGDQSFSDHDVTFYGDVDLNATTGKYDGSFYFDGTGDYLSVPDSANWNFGSGDFTVDTWVRFSDLSSGYRRILSQWDEGTNQRSFMITYNADSSDLRFAYSTNGTNATSTIESWSPSINTWYHLAAVRSGNYLSLFIDGTELGTPTDITGVTFFNSSAVLTLGASLNNGNPDASGMLTGYLDEIRITKGEALWTSNFSAPSEPPNNTPLTSTTTFTGTTTDFDNLEDMSSISSMTLEVPSKAKVVWTNNVDATGDNYDEYITIDDKVVSIDTANLDASLDTEASVTMEGMDCSDFDLYYATGYFTSAAALIADPSAQVVATEANKGGDCTDTDICTTVSCTGTTLTFTAEHFDGFGGGGGGGGSVPEFSRYILAIVLVVALGGVFFMRRKIGIIR